MFYEELVSSKFVIRNFWKVSVVKVSCSNRVFSPIVGTYIPLDFDLFQVSMCL